MTKEEVKELLTTWFVKSNGALNHVVNNSDFYERNNLLDLYSAIIELTNHQPSLNIKDRVKLILSPHSVCVVCGNPTIILNATPSTVCSRACATKLGKKNLDQMSISEKRKNTMIEKYGVSTNSQRKDIKIGKSNLSKEKLDSLNNKEFLYDLHINQRKTSVQISAIIGVYYGTVIDYIKNVHNIEYRYYVHSSIYEDTIEDFLNHLNIDYIKNDRSILLGRELDFYIPQFRLAIEVNGIYWHSEISGNKNRDYHYKKWKECSDKDITLLSITHDKIKNKFEIIKSIIIHKLGKTSTKIYARNCKISQVDGKTSKQFFNENHLQGYAKSSLQYGLYHNEELVSLMSFSNSRFRNDVDLELIRFCNKINSHVIGAASKLFNLVKDKKVVSYSMNDISSGNVYKSLGFKLEKVNSGGYWYTNDGDTLYHRSLFQKHKLKDKLLAFDANLSEWKNMQISGWDRYWDSGTMTWIYNSHQKKS